MNRTAALLSIILALAITAAVPAPAHSQDDGSRNRGYGFLMLEEPANPRNAAMGSAGTALGGAGIRYYNPAVPFFAGYPYVTAEFGQLPGGVNKGGFESAVIFRDIFAAAGFYSSSVDFETRDERGFGSAASSATTIGALSAGYIRGNAAAGVGLTMVEDRIWVSGSYTAFALNAGFGYKLFDNKLSLGAAGFHALAWSKGFGDSVSVWQSGQVPRFVRAGAAWTDALKSLPYAVAADIVYRDEDGTLAVPVGLEVKVLPAIDVRIGKRIGWESEILSFGIGLNIDRISFDAAFIPSVFVDDYEIKWSMAFTYKLGKKHREKSPPAEPPSKPEADQEAPVSKEDIPPAEPEPPSREIEAVTPDDAGENHPTGDDDGIGAGEGSEPGSTPDDTESELGQDDAAY